MTTRLEALEDWASGLLAQLEPAARNKLARRIGQTLRRSQQQRIVAQRNPDGSRYAPRKQHNLLGKQGRVKRKLRMFRKLRTARFLKIQGDGNAINLGFTGRIARIARVHQFGLKERDGHMSHEVKYKERQVLGFTEHDLDLIRDQLLTHIN